MRHTCIYIVFCMNIYCHNTALHTPLASYAYVLRLCKMVLFWRRVHQVAVELLSFFLLLLFFYTLYAVIRGWTSIVFDYLRTETQQHDILHVCLNTQPFVIQWHNYTHTQLTSKHSKTKHPPALQQYGGN